MQRDIMTKEVQCRAEHGHYHSGLMALTDLFPGNGLSKANSLLSQLDPCLQ